METPRVSPTLPRPGHVANTAFSAGSPLARRVGAAAAALGLVGAALIGCSGEPADGAGNTAGSPAGGSTGTIAGTTGTTAGTSTNTGGVNATTGGSTATTGGTNATSAGSGGTSATSAGAGGASSAGAGGNPSGGGTGTMGGRPSGPSAGCMVDPPGTEAPGQNVLHEINITGMAQQYVAGYAHRKYCTTIPKNYDPAKPYPVVFYGPGCGASACENSSFSNHEDIFIVQAIAGADAKDSNTLVPKNAAPGCFQAGREGTVDSPEGFYFDQVMNEVEAKYCVDRGRIYAAGTSSGAWLSNYLACARGNRVRGTAADSGGMHFDHGVCTGGAAVMEMPGDSAVTQDSQKREIGAASVRDLFIEKNGCSKTPTSTMFAGKTCDVYGGCADPVVWCNVGGGHQSGNGLLYSVGMAFWSTLK